MNGRTNTHRVEFLQPRSVTSMIGAIAVLVISSASAQYTFDPSAADEQGNGVKYFGSAKDDRGSLIPGVTVLLTSGQNSFVFVTDDTGRFRGFLPAETAPKTVSPKCSKSGFEFVKAIQRLGLDAPKPYVQVDCVLRVPGSK
jgi:hypothetical protein